MKTLWFSWIFVSSPSLNIDSYQSWTNHEPTVIAALWIFQTIGQQKVT